jgi:hypothetical protein
MSAPVPEVKLAYSRNLLTEVRQGKGAALKQLRDAIAADPQIARSFARERGVELESEKQRRNMMWVKDASSRVKRVDTDFRELCTYTNPLNVKHATPDPALVQRSKAKAAFEASSKASEPQPFLA